MANTVDKIDLFKLHKDEYVAPRKPVLLETKPASYLMVDGSGPPGGEVFQSRIGALYGMAYTMKFQSKFAGRDYAVCKLEGRYGEAGQLQDWTLLIRVPDFTETEHLAQAVTTLREKGKQGEFELVRLDRLAEGRCVQMLHVGPYEKEPETIAKMAAFLEEEGLRIAGRHHEIYLSDPRRVPAERLRTILRCPVG